MSDCSCASVAPYSACRNRRTARSPSSTVILFAAQVAVGDLVIVQDAAALPTSGPQGRLGGIVERGSARGGVRVQRPPAVERGDGQSVRCWRRRDRRWRSPSARDARRRGASRPETARFRRRAVELVARADAARRRCVGSGRTSRRLRVDAAVWSHVGRQHQRSAPGGPNHRQVGHRESTPGHRPHGAVERHLEGWGADDEYHQRADEPARPPGRAASAQAPRR